MDRGLKERLVGAAVLVAIGAWLIPWVLDGPQRLEPTQPAALELPAPAVEEPGLRTETVVLDRRETPPSTEPAAPVATPAPRPVAATADASEPAPPAAAVRPSPAESTSHAESGSSAAASTTEWFAQVGAFGNVDNANRLAARVGTYGYDAQVTAAPGSGGTMHRVRVGPEPTRARAEAIASALSAHGFVARVVFD